jgi:predicted transcriptional regulator
LHKLAKPFITFSYRLSDIVTQWSSKKKDMRYRSRTEIISVILDAANGGSATKTKIMYHAFLSYAQMKEYLRVLTENNLLNYNVDTQTFKTTEKGLRFLDTFNQMDSMIKTPSLPQEQEQV